MLNPALQSRAERLAQDHVSKMFPGGAPLVLDQSATSVQLLSEAPHLRHYWVKQLGRVGQQRFSEYSIFLLPNQTQKIQVADHYWFMNRQGKWIHGFSIGLQDGNTHWTLLVQLELKQ